MCFVCLILFSGVIILFYSYTDPDVPFLESLIPFGNHVLSGYDEMEIQCRVSDPNANVTLINSDTQQPVPSIYDSKRGALGIFIAGTYVCKAVINGHEFYSEEYIVHGWTGVFSCVREYVRQRHKFSILHVNSKIKIYLYIIILTR